MKDYNSIPEIIKNVIEFPKPNHAIEIFEGDFELKNDNCSIKVNGIIYYSWFPEYGNYFKGNILDGDFEKYISNPLDYYDIYINKRKISRALIIKCVTSLPATNSFLKGALTNKIILGEKNLKIDEIKFSVPNLRSLSGNLIRNNNKISKARILLENNLWKIEIDKKSNYDELKEELLITGGYNLLYSGKLSSINKTAFTFERVEDLFVCLNLFLSFINGRNISCLFLNGITNNKVVWTDFTSKSVDIYKDNFSPIFERNIVGMDCMWKEFSNIWAEKWGETFIKNIMHWYIQSKNQAGLIDGSIIMAQTGLEILYFYTTKNNIHPKSSADKLRNLLIYLGIEDKKILAESKAMIKFSTDHLEEKYSGIVGTITTVRNDLIHSEEKFIDKISLQLKFEVYNLNLWLIEISLLKVFNYKGKYCNRISGNIVDFEY